MDTFTNTDREVHLNDLAREEKTIMRKLALYATRLIVLCLCGVSCAPKATPTPIAEQSVKVSISAANNQTQITTGEETAFYVEIDPLGLKEQTST